MSPADRPDEHAAERADRLSELFLGGRARHTATEVVALAGVPADLARRVWLALGLPLVDEDVAAFTDTDADLLREACAMVQAGTLDEDELIAVARVMGRSASRLAEVLIPLIPGGIGDVARAVDADSSEAGLALVERLHHHVWRRHLLSATLRTLDAGGGDGAPLAVAFADLSGFTALTRRTEPDALGRLLATFEDRIGQAVAEQGARQVKSIGDEVLFVAEQPRAAVLAALAAVSAMPGDDETPAVRCGIAYGPVLHREGDVYGPVVNIASRLTALARPGTVLVDREVAGALDGDGTFTVRALRPRAVRGYARLAAHVVRPAGDG